MASPTTEENESSNHRPRRLTLLAEAAAVVGVVLIFLEQAGWTPW